LSPGQRDVDGRRDVVDQVVTRQRCHQAQRRIASPDSDLNEVRVGRKIRLDEDPAAKLLDETAIAPAVQHAIRDSTSPCVGVGEDRQQVLNGDRDDGGTLGAAAAAPAAGTGLAPGLPIPNLLGPSALDGWLQLDGLQAKDSSCYPLQAGLCAPQPMPGCGMVQQQQHAGSDGSRAQVMQQLINQQAMQQLLGLLDAQSTH
jgi:hypothetical protein